MWGAQYLQHFVANLAWILCTKFYHNQPSFIEDMTKTCGSLFPGTRFTLCNVHLFVYLWMCWCVLLMAAVRASVSQEGSDWSAILTRIVDKSKISLSDWEAHTAYDQLKLMVTCSPTQTDAVRNDTVPAQWAAIWHSQHQCWLDDSHPTPLFSAVQQ